MLTREKLASSIDHTLLRPDAVSGDISKICREAVTYKFAAVCIHPWFLPIALQELEGSAVKLCTVIGFPLGADTTASKAFEAADAVRLGARELDMVINLGALKEGNYNYIRQDIAGVVKAARETESGVIVKVIIETSLLMPEEKKTASMLVMETGADFVKTSTGFSTGGATVEDISLIRSVVGPEMGVKASGGIRTLDTAQMMIEAGANRLGTSSGTAIMKEWDRWNK